MPVQAFAFSISHKVVATTHWAALWVSFGSMGGSDVASLGGVIGRQRC